MEAELTANAAFENRETKLTRLMEAKTDADRALASLRLRRLRADQNYGPTPERGPDGPELTAAIRAAAARTTQLDNAVGPLAREASQLGNPTWGPLMRAGSDKSLFARQVERYADVYTSRVANFLAETPFAYLRAARTSLPHDSA